MTVNIPSHFTTQFSSDVELLLQQKGSKLRGLVATGTHTGEQASPINQIGTLTAQSPTGRFAPLARQDVNVARRWVFPVDKEVYQILDDYDVRRLIEDPKPQMAEAAANAIGVAIDQEVIRGSTATAYTGKSGTGTESWDTAYDVSDTFDSSASSGLSYAKIVEGRRLMEAAFVDLAAEPVTLVISSKENADLLHDEKIINGDYTQRPVMENGSIRSFMGMNVVVSEYLATASSKRSCLLFVKSGLYLGLWADVRTRMAVREDLSSKPTDMYINATFGATRTQIGKIVRIYTKQT